MDKNAFGQLISVLSILFLIKTGRGKVFLEIMHVCTYICVMKLEQAIQSTKFKSELQKAGLNILYTAWWLKTVMSQELKTFGLTHEQYNVLRILNGKYPTPMCVRDIACRMIEKNSNVPRIIDRLELKLLVARSTSATDKRETLIAITQNGQNLLAASTQNVDQLFEQLIQMNQQDATVLNNLLEQIRDKEG